MEAKHCLYNLSGTNAIALQSGYWGLLLNGCGQTWPEPLVWPCMFCLWNLVEFNLCQVLWCALVTKCPKALRYIANWVRIHTWRVFQVRGLVTNLGMIPLCGLVINLAKLALTLELIYPVLSLNHILEVPLGPDSGSHWTPLRQWLFFEG